MTLSTVYRVTVEFAHRARPGSISSGASRPRSARAAATIAADVLLDRGRGLLVGGVAHPEAAPHVPDGLLAEARQRGRGAGEGRQLQQLRADVGVDAQQLEPVDGGGELEGARRLRPSRTRTSSSPGRWRSWRGCRRPRPGSPARAPAGARGRPRGRGPPGRRRRSARAAARARRSCRSRSPRGDGAGPSAAPAWDLALPCSSRRSGAKPALSARCSSPPEATSHHSPSPREQLEHGAAGEGLGGEHDLQLLVAAPRRRPPGRPGPVPAGPPRRPRRRASRTRVPARSDRSRRPPGGRAR